MAKKEEVLDVLMAHYNRGDQDMTARKTRKRGWDQVIDAYMGVLPKAWPYQSKLFDPRVRNTILEKTARLINSKLEGRLVPREGGDITKARINNAILSYQWDNANENGSMVEKCAQMDQLTRMFGASFCVNYWDKYKDGPDIKVIDPRDIYIDPSATHIRNAKWVQVREMTTLKKLKELSPDSGWKNIKELEDSIKDGGTKADKGNLYTSQVRNNLGLDQSVNNDVGFPVVEIVTEYRKDRLIVFTPKYGVVIKDIDNPFKHGMISINMLRYYPVPDDTYGQSEVEVVMPLQHAINALLNGFVDEMNRKMQPPLKIVSTQVRMDTIVYGPGAKWIVDNASAITEMNSAGDAIRDFQSSYSAIVGAFNTAMGDSSLGISNVGNFQKAKTATEVDKLETQQNSRDQYNQLYLEQFLKDLMMMWLSMNQQFLLADPSKHSFILRIIGKDKIAEFNKLTGEDVPPEAMAELEKIVMGNPNISDQELKMMVDELKVPDNAVILNPDEKNPTKFKIAPKFKIDDTGELGELNVTKEDLEGTYDFIPDVGSMAMGAGDKYLKARQEALQLVINPQVQGLLQIVGERVKIKELLVDNLESAGFKDAESLFEGTNPGTTPALGPGGQLNPAQGLGGLQGLPQAVPNQPIPGGMAGPQGLQQPTPAPGVAFA